MNKKVISAALAGVLAVAGAGATFAAMNRGAPEGPEAAEISDAAALAEARISLTQAIGVAEQRTGGRAVEAALEGENGRVAYEVAVLKGSTEQEVLIDAKSGAVMKIGAAETEGDEAGEGREAGGDRD